MAISVEHFRSQQPPEVALLTKLFVLLIFYKSQLYSEQISDRENSLRLTLTLKCECCRDSLKAISQYHDIMSYTHVLYYTNKR